MVNNPSFQQQLDAKRRAVASAKKAAEAAAKKYESLAAQLQGWEEAAQCVGGEPNQDTAPTPKRGLSAEWKGVIAEIARRYPTEVSLEEVVTLLENRVQPETVRSQMHMYVDRKYVVRTSPGKFQATADGAAAADVQLGGDAESQNEAADADASAAL